MNSGPTMSPTTATQTCDRVTCDAGRWTEDPCELMDTASCEEEELPALKVRVEAGEVGSHMGVLADPVGGDRSSWWKGNRWNLFSTTVTASGTGDGVGEGDGVGRDGWSESSKLSRWSCESQATRREELLDRSSRTVCPLVRECEGSVRSAAHRFNSITSKVMGILSGQGAL